MNKLKSFFTLPWTISHLLIIVSVFFFIKLGFWQLSRANQKASNNALIELRLQEEIKPFEKIAKDYSLSAAKENEHAAVYRRVTVTGVYDEQQEILIRNHFLNGQPGYHVVTPLKLSNGKALLVKRGWIPTNLDKSFDNAVEPPKSKAELVGVLLPAQNQPQGWFGAKDPSTSELKKAYWVDVERLQSQMPYSLEPVYLHLLEQTPLQNSLPIKVPLPNVNSRVSHLSYAVQWFSFAIIVLVVYTLLMRGLIVRQLEIVILEIS